MILGPDGQPARLTLAERRQSAIREITWYREHVLGGMTDGDFLTRLGEGSISNLRLMGLDGEELRRRISMMLGRFERERYGAFVPERAVTPHNLLREYFAHIIERKGRTP